MITSKHASVIVLTGLLGIVLTQQGCGSDTSGPSDTATAGSSGAATGAAGAGISGGGSSGMASTVAGAPAAGAPAAGAPATGGGGAGGTGGGSTAGAGGSTAGAGGGTAGAGGGSAGAGTGGTSATFAAVKTLFSTSCGTGTCHNKNSGQLDYQGTTDLHGMLTTPIPATGSSHCNGTTLAVPNNAAGSFLVTVVTGPGQSTCKKNGADDKIGRMPDDCSTTSTTPRACFTAAQIKTITDWIAAGAPN